MTEFASDKNDKVIEVDNSPLGVSPNVDDSHGGIDMLGPRPIRWVLGFDKDNPPRPNGNNIAGRQEAANFDPHYWE